MEDGWSKCGRCLFNRLYKNGVFIITKCGSGLEKGVMGLGEVWARGV